MANEVNVSGARPARRTIVKGAAWAVPAIAVATPAMAAGLSQPISPVGCGIACKHPGNPKYYHFVFCFTNTSDVDITVTVGTMTVNGEVRDAFVNCPGGEAGCTGQEFIVPANSTRCKHVDAGTYGDSANGAATLTWGFVDPVTGDEVPGVPVDAGTLIGDGLPPCKDPVKDNPPHTVANPASCNVVIAGAPETTAVEAPATAEPTTDAPPAEETEQTTDTSEATATPNN